MQLNKYDFIILTDELPGFVTEEVLMLESMGFSVVLFSDKIDQCLLNSKKIEIQYTENKSIYNIFYCIYFAILNLELWRDLIALSTPIGLWKQLKIAINWTFKVIELEKIILNNVEITRKTIVYSFWGDEKGLLAAFFAKKYKIKSLSRFHGYDLYAERHGINHFPFRIFLINQLNNLIFISQQGLSYFLNQYPSAQKKSYLSYLGTKTPLEKKLFPETQIFRIVSCSSLIPLKRIDLLFEAVLNLKLSNFNVQWIHFGGGSLFTYFADKIKNLEDASYINFTGKIANDKIHTYYSQNQVDLFVNVSESEGLPFSIIEACSYGIPILATNVGGMNEIVINCENGYILDKNLDVTGLMKAIEKIILLPRFEKENMRKNSLKIWKEKFQAEANFFAFANNILIQG